MNKAIVATTRISEQLSVDLDRLGSMRERSRAWLIEKAIASFVAEELTLRDALDEADAQINRGDGLAHEDFMAQLRSEFVRRKAA